MVLANSSASKSKTPHVEYTRINMEVSVYKNKLMCPAAHFNHKQPGTLSRCLVLR